MPKISVIVPVYKAEAYLRRCVDSILNQTLTDFELILVDDGSPDLSGTICDEYAVNDKRVKVIHKENGGVSSARQAGLDTASGDYVIHADPDDWVEYNMLEELYSRALVDNADMVICDYYLNDEQAQKYIKQRPSKLDSDAVLIELFKILHGSCCNKLVRRDCYNGKVNFPEGVNCCEDLIWCVKFLMLTPKISYVDKAFYHYVRTYSNSQSKVISAKRSTEDMKMLHTLELLLSSKPEALAAMYKRTVIYVMKRAIKTQAFDSVYFKLNFRKYVKYIITSSHYSFMLRLTCFISAIGGYELSKPLVKLMK